MPVSVPNTFASQSGPIPLAQLDADFAALTTWINARNTTFGTFAARPASSPANAGALYIATDQAYSLYADTGAGWVFITAESNFSPGPTYFGFIETSTPATPPAAWGLLYARSSGGSTGLALLSSAGQEIVFSGAAFRAPSTVTVANTTTETNLFSATIKGGLMGTGRMLRCRFWGTYFNATGAGRTVTLSLKLGSDNVLTYTSSSLASAATARNWRVTAEIVNNAVANANSTCGSIQMTAAGTGVNGLAPVDNLVSFASSTVNTAVDQTLLFRTQHSNNDTSITQFYGLVELL